MRKKLYFIASAVLILCVSATMLTACQKEEKSDVTAPKATDAVSAESLTEKQNIIGTENESISNGETSGTTTVYTYNDSNGYTVYSYVEATNAPAAPETAPPTPNNTVTEKPTSVEATAAIEDYPTVPEVNNGIMCVRTQYASRGQIVTVSVIMGTPNSEYSIEFYENETRLSDVRGLENKKADTNGTVEWSFIIDDDCELGNRKLVIKEKGSDKYTQTFITVNG